MAIGQIVVENASVCLVQSMKTTVVEHIHDFSFSNPKIRDTFNFAPAKMSLNGSWPDRR